MFGEYLREVLWGLEYGGFLEGWVGGMLWIVGSRGFFGLWDFRLFCGEGRDLGLEDGVSGERVRGFFGCWGLSMLLKMEKRFFGWFLRVVGNWDFWRGLWFSKVGGCVAMIV